MACKTFYNNTYCASTVLAESAVYGHSVQLLVQVRKCIWIASCARLTPRTEKANRQRVSWPRD